MRPPAPSLVEDVREHEREDAYGGNQHVDGARLLRQRPGVHGEHDPGEPEQQAHCLAQREGLAQEPRRQQREEQGVGAGDDGAHSGGQVPQRLVVQAEIEGVAAGAEEQQPQPGPPVAGDAQAGEPCADEQRTPGEEEADPEDGERRRGAGEDAAGDERGCPEKDVEDCDGRSEEARRMMPRGRPWTGHGG